MADRHDTIQHILSQETIPFPKSNRFRDKTGRRFGRLVVLRFAGTRDRKAFWDCVCDCGNPALHKCANPLISGDVRSCGCLAKEKVNPAFKHGLTETPTWNSWFDMLRRCNDPKNHAYADYGGRGIAVCEQWQGEDGFVTFLADMGERPEGLTLDRIDNNKGYSPENCRWATKTQQARNRRSAVMITHNGRTQSLIEWAEELSLPYHTLKHRIQKLKWDAQRALTLPVVLGRNQFSLE